ncbi:MAG: hypothetical protein ACTSWZ_02030 [Candidatus Heimdallarchaeaceae archaeon]
MSQKESVKKIDAEIKKLKEKIEKSRKKSDSSRNWVNYDTFSIIF